MPNILNVSSEKSIALVGLMGAGKTSVGQKLAKILNLDFADSDREVEKIAGIEIPKIFSVHGEKKFRDYEKKAIEKLLTIKPIVLATGGGAFMDEDIRTLIKRHAISVWIKADLATLINRIKYSNSRPLIKKNNEREILNRFIVERYPIYGKADITIVSETEAIDTTVKKLVLALKEGNS